MGALQLDRLWDTRPANNTLDSEVYAQATIALIGVEEGKIVAYNDGAELLFRVRRDDAVGARLESLFAPAQREELKDCLQRASRGIPSFPCLLAHRADATPTEVELRIGPLRVASRIIGATVVVMDVRRRNRSMRELRAERDRERARANAAADALGQARRELDRADDSSGTFRESAERIGHWLEVGDEVETENERTEFNPVGLIEQVAAALKGRTQLSVAFSPTLDDTVLGYPTRLKKLVHSLFSVAHGDQARLRGIVQTRRDDWALVRIEVDEPVSWQRTPAEWSLLRRMATRLEGALGHEHIGDARRRVWLTFNVFR